ncbi:MAG: VWA domain-containing protein [Acidobacteriota bacterium]
MRRVVIHQVVPLLVVAAIVSSGGQQLSPPAGAQALHPFEVSVNVDLVQVYATVRDREGRFVAGLVEGDFEVYEDGVKQTVRLFAHEDIPVTVGLVVDHSGSMRGKLTEVTSAARSFVQSSNPEDQMFVVNFNEYVSLGLPPSIRFTNRSEELEAAILNAPATGQTALYDATAKALHQLLEDSRNKKVLVIISDGGDNVSKHTLAQILDMAGRSSALIYTIGIFEPDDPDRNSGVLRQLAQASGGEAFFPGELANIVAVCEGIASDIRNQYSLGYVSHNPTQSSANRKIRVTAKSATSGKLRVRARAGYITGPALDDTSR